MVAIPAAWTMSSVVRFFGFWRAAGADHFDEGLRTEPFVRRGAFARVPNAMYTLGFLGLWAIAIAAGSRSGLVAAAASHVYIWVHYLCTERPDMDVIYSRDLATVRQGR